MKTDSIYLPKILSALALGVAVTFGAFYSATTQAAQGCGWGYHRYGHACVPNHPGYHSRYIKHRCWINAWGHRRCR